MIFSILLLISVIICAIVGECSHKKWCKENHSSNHEHEHGYTLVEVVIVLGALVTLTIIGAIIYVAIHFIAKVW
jgi:hypothetical protein